IRLLESAGDAETSAPDETASVRPSLVCRRPLALACGGGFFIHSWSVACMAVWFGGRLLCARQPRCVRLNNSAETRLAAVLAIANRLRHSSRELWPWLSGWASKVSESPVRSR